MPAVTIRNIPVKVHRDLKKRAKRNGNSTEAELRLILKEASRQQVAPAPAPQPTAQPEVGFGTKLQEIARRHGVSFPDFVRDKTPLEPWNFDE
jgi:plasmid stability protein